MNPWILLNSYKLLIIYARLGLIQLYRILVMFVECWERKLLIQARVEKLNGDLHQPYGIRYVSRSFSVRCLFILHIGKGLISVVTLSVMVPQAIGSFLRNRIGDHTREVPSCFSLMVFGIQCTWISLIYLFLCRAWGHVFPIGS